MAATEDMLKEIEVEALTLDGSVVGVQILLFGVPVHYVSATASMGLNDGAQIGPCEMWLHWGHEAKRIRHRALDESRTALQG